MTDEALWRFGVATVASEMTELRSDQRAALERLVSAIQDTKASLQAVADNAGCSSACADCGGACCDCGKYHFTVVDLLVILTGPAHLFTPRFSEKCPYMADRRCLMSPVHRPFNCITFICDTVENSLSLSNRDRFYNLERELRKLYERVEQLFCGRFMHGLLINAEHALASGNSQGILRVRHFDPPVLSNDPEERCE